MTDLSYLIERVRGVAGADDPTLRYIDCHMWVLGQGGDARMHACDSSMKDFVWERGMDGLWVRGVVKFRDVPKYTASIDAITDLIEKKLPGWHVYSTTVGERDMPQACLTEPGGDCRDFVAHHVSEALARTEALLLSIQESSK